MDAQQRQEMWREQQQHILERMRSLPDSEILPLRYGLLLREESIRPVHAQLLAEREILWTLTAQNATNSAHGNKPTNP